MSIQVTFPLTVNVIEFADYQAYREHLLFGGRCGDYVAVRPCAPEFEGKTFLGILVGEIPLAPIANFDIKTRALKISLVGHNPLIFIPERKTTVLGCASFWRRIQTPEQLREISDADISNLWYVKALKELTEQNNTATDGTAVPDPAQLAEGADEVGP